MEACSLCHHASLLLQDLTLAEIKTLKARQRVFSRDQSCAQEVQSAVRCQDTAACRNAPR